MLPLYIPSTLYGEAKIFWPNQHRMSQGCVALLGTILALVTRLCKAFTDMSPASSPFLYLMAIQVYKHSNSSSG